jgi:hypothetical protein
MVKRVTVICLVMLLLLVGLPLAMGMGDMPTCPECSSAGALPLLGMCVAVVALVMSFVLPLLRLGFQMAVLQPPRLYLAHRLERPPRAA